MASKREIEGEHKRDMNQWGHRVVHAMKDYHNAVYGGEKALGARAIAFNNLRQLVKEKIELGYDFEEIDSFGVSDFSEEDRKMLINMEEKMEEEMER